ncbi:MAG: glycosyltransferase family 87 protein [Terracidiphilus sp.]
MADKLVPPPAQERINLAEMLIGLCAGLALVLGAIYFALQIAGYPSGSRSLAGSRDFVSYWATGRQLVLHGNPYDTNAIAALEHREGLSSGAVLIMRNPPWALPFAYPLGFLGLRLAALLWSVLLLACLLVSVRLVRQLYGDPPNRLHWLALSFTPCLICITMGQTSLFALLGLVLFLRWHGARPFLAGASLWLCALKPHLFLPFAAALVAWIIVSRAWKLLAGAAASLALSSALASLLYPHAWLDYERLLRSPTVENDLIPCLACALRQWIAPHATWLQYLPAALCCMWALVYYWRRRAAWDWRSDGGLLMLVSLAAAPYCWFYDQCLAIPALMDGAYASRSRNVVAVLALAIFALDIQICIVHIVSPLYLWSAPAWLAWYILAQRFSQPRRCLTPAAREELFT